MMTTIHSTSPIDSRSSETRLGQFVRAVRQLPAAYRIYRERQELMGLSEHTLKDIGLSRADAYREASRPFWHVPQNR